MSQDSIFFNPPPRPREDPRAPEQPQAEPVEIRVDGVALQVPADATLLDACRARGVDTPTLCFAENLTPVNVCRVCVVELEGSRALVPACSRRVEPGMQIHTDSERVRLARRMVLELLASSVDLSTAPQALEYARRYGARPERHGSGARTSAQPVKLDNDLYVRDYAKCILCYKCVEACGSDAQNSFAIAVAGRGFDTRISTESDVPLPESACVYCGNCIGACPTGALMPKSEFELRRAGRWDESRQHRQDTICAYCGVGCTLTLHVQENRIVKVTSPTDSGVTRGHLCIKGRFGYEFVHAEPEDAGG